MTLSKGKGCFSQKTCRLTVKLALTHKMCLCLATPGSLLLQDAKMSTLTSVYLIFFYSSYKPNTNWKASDCLDGIYGNKMFLHSTKLTLCVASFLISSCSLFKMWRFGLFFLAYCWSSITLLSEFSCKRDVLLKAMWQVFGLTRQCEQHARGLLQVTQSCKDANYNSEMQAFERFIKLTESSETEISNILKILDIQ